MQFLSNELSVHVRAKFHGLKAWNPQVNYYMGKDTYIGSIALYLLSRCQDGVVCLPTSKATPGHVLEFLASSKVEHEGLYIIREQTLTSILYGGPHRPDLNRYEPFLSMRAGIISSFRGFEHQGCYWVPAHDLKKYDKNLLAVLTRIKGGRSKYNKKLKKVSHHVLLDLN